MKLGSKTHANVTSLISLYQHTSSHALCPDQEGICHLRVDADLHLPRISLPKGLSEFQIDGHRFTWLHCHS